MVETMASLKAFHLIPPPSRVVSRPNSLPVPFQTPAMQAKEKHKIKQINTFGTL